MKQTNLQTLGIDLFNPAFCGETIRRVIKGFEKYSDGRKFPFELTPIALALLLHRSTRDQISTTQRKTLNVWISDRPYLKIGFGKRISNYEDYFKESIIFLLRVENIKINSDCEIELIKTKFKGLKNHKIDGHIDSIFKKAEKVGKWFAEIGNTKQIFVTLGIKP